MSEREEYSGDLSAYLDGELSESRQRRLDEVLRYDRELTGELDRLRATRELIRCLPPEQPPREFVHRVLARGQQMRLLASLRRPRSYRWVTLAAAAVVLVAAGLGVVITLGLPWKQPADTIHEVGRLARAPEGPPEGGVAEVHGKKVGGPARPAPPDRGYEETAREKYSKGGPADEKLREKSLVNGHDSYAAKVVSAPRVGRKSKSSLESTLAAARPEAGRLTKGDAGEANVVIYTDNLAFAQRDVESVLAFNRIQPVRSTVNGDTVPGKRLRARANFFNTTQTTVSQVQYEVFVPPKQAVELKNQLHVIRAQQKVSQAAMPTGAGATAGMPKLAKIAKVAPRKIDAGAAEEPAGKKTPDEDKSAPKQAKPKPAKPTGAAGLDRKVAVAHAGEEKPAKTEGKPITKAEPSPKTLADKAADRLKPAAKPGDADVAVAAKTGRETVPAPAATGPPAGALAPKEARRRAAEAGHRLDKRPGWGQRTGKPSNDDTRDGQKDQTAPTTAPTTAPARPPKEAPSTQAVQAVLAARQLTSQRAGQIESQAGANVMRLLITLNYRDARPSRPTAEALMKAASRKAQPAAEIKANQSH